MNFIKLTTLLVRKSAKSIQLVLNEWSKLDAEIETVTASAFCQARQKLKHQAFIELNQKCLVSEYYQSNYQKYLDFRLLAIDCTYFHLPNSESCQEVFGKIKIHDPASKKDSFVHARASVLYDILNDICIDGVIESRSKSERELARNHYQHFANNDLVVLDRGYPGFNIFAELLVNKVNFVARCSKIFSKNFKFKGNQQSIDIEIKSNKYAKNKLEDFDYPEIIKLRALKIKLKTGEYEILVTSLVDNNKYPTSLFKEIYGLRWGIETMFKVLKSRLTLENFTGKSAEAVKQDFYATLFISNLETILTEDLDQDLSNNIKNKNKQKVNKAVSFNVIRDRAFELLCSSQDIDPLLGELSKLMLMNTTAVRKDRVQPERRTQTKRGRDPKIHFHRNVAKMNF